MTFRGSIRNKMAYTFVVILFITVFAFELIFTFGVKTYYYSNIEQVLTDKIQTTLDIYNTYLGYESLGRKAKFILENDAVPDYVEAQVLDMAGNIVETTAYFVDQQAVDSDDFNRAREGVVATWRGRNRSTGERVMSVSAPLYQAGQVNGVIRYTTSVEAVSQRVNEYLISAYFIGLIILLLVLYLSTLMSNRVIRPIYELKDVADSIAAGDLSARARQYDRDEIGELAETINYMAAEIKKTENLKNDFISSISHELRTPLTSIKGWSETILTGDISNTEETKLGLEIISRESERLSGLVEQLLDFSKLEANRIQLSPVDFNIVELVERVFKQLSINLKEHKISYGISYDKKELIVYGDKNRLRQVLINILDNAIKFTPDYGRIDCRIHQDDGGLTIDLADNGSGIAPEHLAKIEEQFYKIDPNTVGSGLGLAITKRIVGLHGGELNIESQLNRGTVVTIYLPNGGLLRL